MNLETVVKIEGYSVEYQEKNDTGEAQSNEIESAVSLTSVPLIPGPCGFQNYDSTSPTGITFYRIIKRIVNAGESPLTSTKDVKGGSSRKEEASAEKKFKCFIPNCSKSFANKHTLSLHQIYDHRENWFKCHLCECSFPIEFVLKNHLTTHPTAPPYVCSLCSKLCDNSYDLWKHKRKHQITNKVTQKSRSEKVQSTKIVMLRKTPRRILPKTPLPVSFGAVPFPNVSLGSKSSTEKSSQLVKHEPDQLLETQPQMSITTTTLSCLPDSSNEIKAELVDLDLPTFPQVPLLKVNPTLKCDVCLKDFKSHRELGCHRSASHAPENEKQFKCHVCPKSFVVMQKLKFHLYFVHGEKSENLKILECEFCGREFPCVSRLEAHVLDKHVVDKEFECSVCSKTFVDQDALTKHQVKVHEQGTINHFCDVCSAGFTSRRNLGIHVKKVHEKLYCSKCGRCFENKFEFNQHLNSNEANDLKEGLKLKCQVCFVLLSTQCNFNIHTDCHLKEIKSTLVST